MKGYLGMGSRFEVFYGSYRRFFRNHALRFRAGGLLFLFDSTQKYIRLILLGVKALRGILFVNFSH